MFSRMMRRRANIQNVSRVFLPMIYVNNGMSTEAGSSAVPGVIPTSVKSERINKNLHLRKIVGGNPDEDSTKRPVVLLYTWLVAKAKHIHKYGDYYLGKGFDVLNIKVEPTQLLIPTRAQDIAHDVLDFVSDSPQKEKPIIVHAFSVGGYMYGETLVKMIDNERFGAVKERMLGQIFDSPVDFHGIPSGFSKAVTSQVVVQKSLEKFLEIYLTVTKNYTTKHYLRASDVFKDNRQKLKSLFLYSRADPVGDAFTIEKTIQGWQNKGIDVASKCWDKSPHVSHFHFYRDEYITALDGFINSICPQTTPQEKEELKKLMMEVQ